MGSRLFLAWSSDEVEAAGDVSDPSEIPHLELAAANAGCDAGSTVVCRLETVRLADVPDVVYVRVVARDGTFGLGEAFGTADVVEEYIHRVIAPQVVGESPHVLGRLSLSLLSGRTRPLAGERRAASAVDLALWDLLGRASGSPLHELLGGACRERIRVYDSPRRDQQLFAQAESLLSRQITAIKVELFEEGAGVEDGGYLSEPDLERAIAPLRAIRSAFGNRLDIILDFHGRWDLPTAKRIARAVEELDPFWLEEPLRPDDLASIAAYARAVRLPMTLREPLTSRYEIRDLLDRRIAGVVMFSLGWSGGMTGGSQVAALADAYGLPLTLYGRAGPVLLSAATHLAVSAPNALIQEIVGDYYADWYGEVASGLPDVSAGTIAPPAGSGHGVNLLPDAMQPGSVTVRSSR